jgi:Holliday junction resolvase
MPHPSKRKGSRFERELVAGAEAAGLTAVRAYASDGRALGCAETVDVLVHDASGTPWKVQAKRRASVASYLTPPDGADVTVVRADRAEALVVLPWARFLRMLASASLGAAAEASTSTDAEAEADPAPLFDGMDAARALYGGPEANP